MNRQHLSGIAHLVHQIAHKRGACDCNAFDEHEGFQKLENSLAHRKGVSDPKALAAAIGRKKYGAAGMARMAAAGRK
jgi:hypothetical protein